MNPQNQFSPQGGQGGQQPQSQPGGPVQQQTYQQPQAYGGSYGAQQPGGYGQPVSQQPAAPASYTPIQSHSSGRGRTVNGPNKWLIVSVCFILASVALAGLAGWALVNYADQKNNVDGKGADAVALAVKDQKTRDAAERLEADKEPNRIFSAGDDLGQLSFKYPKTWSVYEATDRKASPYEVIFNPGVISATAAEGAVLRYSLRLKVETADYDETLSSYEAQVTDGTLNSSAVKINEQQATRFDGTIEENVVGSIVVFKLRDKTVTLRTDAEAFKGDFNALIQTVTFNK